MSHTGITKHGRILELYTRLMQGEVLSKKEEAARYDVNERSIQRDIDDLRCFLAERENYGGAELKFDRLAKGYRLVQNETTVLTGGEVFAITKVLLESRAFPKRELSAMMDKLLATRAGAQEQAKLTSLLANERHHYIEPHHGVAMLDRLWGIAQAVDGRQVLQVQYVRTKDQKAVERLLHPVGIMFSEYYFYLTAFIENIDKEKEFDSKDDLFPTIYRIDRIATYKVLDRRFEVPYKARFEEGEFRKRVQFMYGGTLETAKFTYCGPSVEAVLDRLPTAVIEHEENGVYTVSAEVFGTGIDMWLRSQGDAVRLVERRKS